ncbi:hypothetical protein MWU50_08410 [Flavobacteriaceae bacterium S0862]|nr:hypothetical protein [Flavobacteriaceae bacterium S0862]
MKKLIKIASGVALMFALALTLSSFTTNAVEPDNNGVEVTIIRGHQYQLSSCDNGWIMDDRTTRQFKDGVLHMRTTTYTLPEGDGCIPKKATKISPWPGYTLNYTPSGKVVVKEIYN